MCFFVRVLLTGPPRKKFSWASARRTLASYFALSGDHSLLAPAEQIQVQFQTVAKARPPAATPPEQLSERLLLV